MRVPSRVYVGILVFGLIASLTTLTYTVLFLSGYRPPPEPPLIYLEPPAEPAKQFFLILASLFSIGLTVMAWRELLASARRDASLRRRREEVARLQRRYKQQVRDERRPPGPT